MLAVNIIFFTLIVGTLSGFILHVISLDKKSRWQALKNYKKGRFFWFYIFMVPLYIIGIMYAGEKDFFLALFSSITYCVDIIILKVAYAPIAQYIEYSMLYRITMMISFAILFINTAIVLLSLFAQRIFNFYNQLIAMKWRKKIYLVIGYNSQNKNILDSIQNHSGIILANLSSNEIDDISITKNSFVKFNATDDLGQFIQYKFKSLLKNEDKKNKLKRLIEANKQDTNLVSKYKKKLNAIEKKLKKIYIIINTHDDALNILLVDQLATFINKRYKEVNELFVAIDAYVFGNAESENAFTHYVEKTKGCIHFVNKYKLVALDFINNYPITKYMDAKHIDYEKGVIKSNVETKVIFIGFGATNQHIFTSSVINNQLITLKDGSLQDFPISYYIISNKRVHSDKDLNHNYSQYEKFCLNNNNQDYLPLAPLPANVIDLQQIDVNDYQLYQELEKIFKPSKEGNIVFANLVIAYGSDMENFDLGEKIYNKLVDWGALANCEIFIKIRNDGLASNVIMREYKDCKIHAIGKESSMVYNVEQIVNERIETLAKQRHYIYSLLSEMKADPSKEISQIKEGVLIASTRSWYGKFNQVKRNSNIYASISLRLKLNLLGYDYVLASNSDKEDASEQFLAQYQAGNPINFSGEKLEGINIIIYQQMNYEEETIRVRLAIQEHNRWNAYMILSGYLPATRYEIEHNSSREYEERRRHGNITTFDGLKQYAKITAKRKKISLEEADVIKYDFQILDEAKDMLEKVGFKIVRKD